MADAVPVRPAPTEALQQQPAVQQRTLPPEGLEGGPPESYLLPEPVNTALCGKRVFTDITKVKT